MNTRDRARFEAKLQALRQKVLSLGAEAIAPNRDDPTAKSDDDAQALNEMHQAIASRHNQARLASLERINAALQRLRLDPEDFGLCRDCEEEIAPRRLELLPFAEYCVACQSKRDDPRDQSRRKLTDYVG